MSKKNKNKKPNKYSLKLKKLKDYIFDNFNSKLISFIFAIFMYIFISIITRSEKTFISELEIKGLRNDLTISNDIPQTIKIIASDKQNVLDKITEEDFELSIDLSSIETSTIEKRNIPIDVTIPRTMKSFFSSIKLDPENIYIVIEPIVNKSVPVVISTEGEVVPDYIIKEKRISPSEVRIRGAKNIVEKIQYIETTKINLQGEYSSFTRFVDLQKPHRKISIINTNRVEVNFNITKKTDSKTIRHYNIGTYNLDQQFELELVTKPITLILSGPESIMTDLTPNNISLTLDCSEIFVPSTYEYPYKKLDIDLPDEIELTSINPRIIKVNIKKKE